MAKIESEAILNGPWRNFDELEDNLSIPELNAIIEAIHDREFRLMKFQAGLKGIDIGGSGSGSKFEEIEQRAADRIAAENAKLAGTELEAAELASIGMAFESE